MLTPTPTLGGSETQGTERLYQCNMPKYVCVVSSTSLQLSSYCSNHLSSIMLNSRPFLGPIAPECPNTCLNTRIYCPCWAAASIVARSSSNCSSCRFIFGYQGGRTPTAWPHTAQSGEPDCRGPEAKPHQRDTPNTPIPGGAQCPDQNSVGVEPTHLLGVLQRLPAQRNHAHPTTGSSHWPPQ
jgi:hypothetical protein